MESFSQIERDKQGMQSRFDRMEAMLENVINNQQCKGTDESSLLREGL